MHVMSDKLVMLMATGQTGPDALAEEVVKRGLVAVRKDAETHVSLSGDELAVHKWTCANPSDFVDDCEE